MNSLTNSLSQNSEKTLTESAEKLISTKELAAVLGVDIKTIQRTVDSLDMNVERAGSSHTMMFNAAQATAIKIELQNHSKVAQNGFNSLTISNDIEMLVIGEKLRAYQEMRIQQLTQELNTANQKVIELKPAADAWKAFAEKDGTFCVTKVASCLGLQPKTIFSYLETKGYISHSSGRWTGTVLGTSIRGYISNDIVTGDKYSTIQMRLTPKGMQKVAEAFGKTSKSIEETADKIIDSDPDKWIKAE